VNEFYKDFFFEFDNLNMSWLKEENKNKVEKKKIICMADHYVYDIKKRR
jgi:hypothetical protein